MRGRICEHAGFELMHACRAPDGIVEVESALLSDPGLAMVDAARAVRRAVYGPPR
jgi:iron complex transport system substrate-binding protein